jgi:hypothetical protein
MITEKPDIYQHFTLLRLAELIARDGDNKALQELHNNRRLFYYHSRSPLRMAEFIDKLRQSSPARRWCNAEADILEKAYDLTISKFSNLPCSDEKSLQLKPQGPDCRYYYEAFIKQAEKTIIDNRFYDRDDNRERQMAKLLQNLIVRHFRLSCQECSRRDRKFTTRYLWQVDGHSMEVFLPADLNGRQRGKWLTENIPDVEPARAGERQRVQAIIDDLTKKRRILSLGDIEENTIAAKPFDFESQIEQELIIKGLADVVAREKADNIELQRDAIQKLGRQKLQQLICEIFDCLAWSKYEAAKIADSFGINRATFSRFAGSSWLTQSGKSQDYPIPDLWLNTAQTLAGHPVFVRVAEDAGILGRVEQVLKAGNARRRNGVYK